MEVTSAQVDPDHIAIFRVESDVFSAVAERDEALRYQGPRLGQHHRRLDAERAGKRGDRELPARGDFLKQSQFFRVPRSVHGPSKEVNRSSTPRAVKVAPPFRGADSFNGFAFVIPDRNKIPAKFPSP